MIFYGGRQVSGGAAPSPLATPLSAMSYLCSGFLSCLASQTCSNFSRVFLNPNRMQLKRSIRTEAGIGTTGNRRKHGVHRESAITNTIYVLMISVARIPITPRHASKAMHYRLLVSRCSQGRAGLEKDTSPSEPHFTSVIRHKRNRELSIGEDKLLNPEVGTQRAHRTASFNRTAKLSTRATSRKERASIRDQIYNSRN